MDWVFLGKSLLVILGLFLVFWVNWKLIWKAQRESGSYLSVVLLMVVQNQEKIIEGVIRQLRWLRLRSPVFFELVVVDSGSRDNTNEILHRLWRCQEDFRFYRLEETDCGANPLEVVRRDNFQQTIYLVELDYSASLGQVVKAIDRALQGDYSNEMVRIVDKWA
ncbi:MAG: glycosyltransferase [Bacillota bacterium]|jgi:hypothetical protein